MRFNHTFKWAMLFSLIAALLVGGAAFAQDSGEYDPRADDGRLNIGEYSGGLAVYCVNRSKAAAASYEGGGGFLVLDARGEQILFVSERAINRGIAEVERTGTYATLGTSTRLWYGGQPVVIYRLTSDEFQMNAADEHGKTVEFRWSGCREVPPQMTNDGCKAGWDRDASGACVFLNLY